MQARWISIVAVVAAVGTASAQSAVVQIVPGPTATWLVAPAGNAQRVSAYDGYREVQILDGAMQPIAGYPFQDIFLSGCSGANFSLCNGGLSADSNTNANGETTMGLSGFASAGGWTLQSQISLGGAPVGSCFDLRINSPDGTGDLVVDLADVSQWATDATSARQNLGVMAFRSDLYPEGLFNMLDLALQMRHMGELCP